MLGFGGGLKKMLDAQGISALELVKLLIYLTPIVLTFSLPVAALFSATITYGRFSADNEINACRASGINIHKLLLPAFVLSILVFLATFVLQNFAYPRLITRIESMVSRDMQTISYMQLKQNGFISYLGFTLHCDHAEEAAIPRQQPDGTWTPGRIRLSKVAFVQHEHDEPVMYGTAKDADVVFDRRAGASAVSVQLNQVRMFKKDQGTYEVAQGEIGPIAVPPFMKRRIKFLSLTELRSIVRDPMTFGDFKEGIEKGLYAPLREALVYQDIMQQMAQDSQCQLEDAASIYRITMDKGGTLVSHPQTGRITLEPGVSVKQIDKKDRTWKLFSSPTAIITAQDIGPNANPLITISMKGKGKDNVRISYSTDVDPEAFDEKPRLELEKIPAPDRVLAESRTYTLDRLLDPAPMEIDYIEKVSSARHEAAKQQQSVISKAATEIHSRFAYSASALVLLTLGAGLGIMFRGGHLVSAFGLSFIPMTLVVVMIITGKQISQAGIMELGVAIMYAGVVLVMLANVVVLGKFLRR
jgi:lipopolysaccharide export LptBFGC system permease protein LptF